ncbi:MAG: DUF362 domain-containing protein [Nitrospinae bacterium]|jgi:uncharacterized protein (DUF362 family)|nr:DUF362 domain-containing protein [Nitrospinota bacterium]MDA1108876.1 DUF362 domain-containing protein [Nitrospinota bacterium]
MKTRILLKKIERYDLNEVEQFVRDSFSEFDSADRPFRSGQKVLLKPNLLRAFKPDRCVTTHPVLLEAVCRVLKDRSINHIAISDSPALGSLPAVARKAGYGPLAKKYGVHIVPLSDPVALLTEESIPHLKIAGNLQNYDHIINLPKFKSHCQMTLTLSIKNLFGLVIGKRKPVLHCLVNNDKVKFGKMLVDIAKHVNPSLTIVDGIQAMQGQGPANGTPYPLGVLAAGQDLTALDRVLTEIVGVPPEKVYALEAARLKEFGTYDLDAIEILGENNLDALKVSDFQLAEIPLDISFNPFRVLKSFLKQVYEVKIKEKLVG